MLHIGWATKEFSPERPVMLQGQMHRRIARAAMDPLLVTALAIEGGNLSDCAILISCDLCGISTGLQEAVRARLAARLPAVLTEKVILNATHTHTSLVLEDGPYAWPGGDVMTPQECTAWVADRAAEAAAQAWESRAPQAIGRAFAHAVVGHNRRTVYANGTAQMYGRTDREEFISFEGYEDHSLDLLFTWGEDGHVRGLIIDIPCPSQVDENLEVTSADYWHEVRLALRARFGHDTHVLPLCGAAGDQSPHFLLYGRQEEEMRRRRGVTERQEIAARVAAAVERALPGTQPMTDTTFAHLVRHIALSPRGITPQDREWAAAEYARAVRAEQEDTWWLQRLRAIAGSSENDVPPDVPIEMHVLRIGDMALATNPFELFLDYGLRIKARSPATQTVVVQLAAGTAGYLPTERAVRGGGYSAIPAVASVGPTGGQQLVEGTLQAIRELFPSE